MSNTWDGGYFENYSGRGGYDKRYNRPRPESITDSPASMLHRLYQILLRDTPSLFLINPIERFPLWDGEGGLESMASHAGEEPDVHLSRAEIEALFRDRVEFSSVEGSDGVIVAKVKGKSPHTPSSDE